MTASHNPACDNGAKVVDCSGAMLAQEWEVLAGQFVNAGEVGEAVERLVEGVGMGWEGLGKAVVVVGGDCRESTAGLVEAVKMGVEAVVDAGEDGGGGGLVDLGVVTTPQLHFVVRARDRGEAAGLVDYYEGMCGDYARLCGEAAGREVAVCVDCANGVGSYAMGKVVGLFDKIVTVNRVGDGELNFECGADFVQKKRVVPTVYGKEGKDGVSGLPAETIWASLDGDADRLVMYTVGNETSVNATEKGTIALADGDRFSALTASFLSELLDKAGMGDVVIGVAQTAYSNGAATEFLEGVRGVKVVTAKTGVKHLEVAVHPFDIGVYWEPNGHGTVLYSDKVFGRVTNELAACPNGEEFDVLRSSLEALRSVGRLANQAVGDGIADLLLVLAILQRQKMSFFDWIGLYPERCSANLVVKVADKDVIVTEDCDRVVSKPDGLRAAVDTAMKAGIGRRAFVRPSGTEDVVRVYAEAPAGSQDVADAMALSIAQAVYDTCAGVGPRL